MNSVVLSQKGSVGLVRLCCVVAISVSRESSCPRDLVDDFNYSNHQLAGVYAILSVLR